MYQLLKGSSEKPYEQLLYISWKRTLKKWISKHFRGPSLFETIHEVNLEKIKWGGGRKENEGGGERGMRVGGEEKALRNSVRVMSMLLGMISSSDSSTAHGEVNKYQTIPQHGGGKHLADSICSRQPQRKG